MCPSCGELCSTHDGFNEQRCHERITSEIERLREGSSGVAEAYYGWATALGGSREQEIAHGDLIDSAAQLRLAMTDDAATAGKRAREDR